MKHAQRQAMARKFLYIIAGITVLILIGAISLAIWSRQATEIAFVPRTPFVEQTPLADNAYSDPAMWYSRPGMGTNDPARYEPAIEAKDGTIHPGQPADPSSTPRFAVFFVHPTSYLPLALSEKANWNDTLNDPVSEARARLYLRGMASAFNRADEIWAPKYRQAAVGAFLTDKPEAQKAIDAAYGDVREAFRYFVASVPKDEPIVLAGHSQGALHILHLLRSEIAGTPLQKRIIAVYAIGWPISVEHDLPALPMPACAAPSQTGCIVTWSSFAEDADPTMLMTRYAATPGFDGKPRGNGPILCVNPLTGSVNGSAPASANLGTLVPSADLSSGTLVAGAVPARCNAQGLLMIGSPPEMGQGVLPGNNYHVYDIPLFWRNLQQDVVRRAKAWKNEQS